MKTNIKARITGLFICKTTIMVNKRENNLLYNSYFRETAILILSFILSLSFYYFLLFSLTFFVLISSYLSGKYILFCRHNWAELSFLFWTFLSGTIFSSGGGCTSTQCIPPLRTRLKNEVNQSVNIDVPIGYLDYGILCALLCLACFVRNSLRWQSYKLCCFRF